LAIESNIYKIAATMAARPAAPPAIGIIWPAAAEDVALSFVSKDRYNYENEGTDLAADEPAEAVFEPALDETLEARTDADEVMLVWAELKLANSELRDEAAEPVAVARAELMEAAREPAEERAEFC
jgi:hypothetical protein